MPRPHDVVKESLESLRMDPLFSSLTPAAWLRIEHALAHAVANENEACMMNLWNATEGKEREAMVVRFADVDQLLKENGEVDWPPSNLHTPFWTRWYPGLENDHLTVSEVLDTLPGFSNDDIPAVIKAFESPSSPLKLPGACTLEQHDILHVLLGRGLVDQDEAFVLGFTAVADPQFSDDDIDRYKFAFSIYPEPYCIRGCDLIAFDLGVEAARRMKLGNLAELDATSARHQVIGELRTSLGIDKAILYEVYAQERLQIATPWSKRLPQLHAE